MCTVVAIALLAGLCGVSGLGGGTAESVPIHPTEAKVAYAVPSSVPYSWLDNGHLMNELRSREGRAPSAITSSPPYSWLRNGDFLNYLQWRRGATWATSERYGGARDTVSRDVQSDVPAMWPADERRASEKTPL
jgi:hypothetical protein